MKFDRFSEMAKYVPVSLVCQRRNNKWDELRNSGIMPVKNDVQIRYKTRFGKRQGVFYREFIQKLSKLSISLAFFILVFVSENGHKGKCLRILLCLANF